VIGSEIKNYNGIRNNYPEIDYIINRVGMGWACSKNGG
jgi:hypothetical protein